MRGNSPFIWMRTLLASNVISRFCWILECKGYLAKVNNLPNDRGTGPPEARGPMQPHRLHRLQAGPAFETETRPETFETETSKNGSRDSSRDRDQVSRLHRWLKIHIYCEVIFHRTSSTVFVGPFSRPQDVTFCCAQSSVSLAFVNHRSNKWLPDNKYLPRDSFRTSKNVNITSVSKRLQSVTSQITFCDIRNTARILFCVDNFFQHSTTKPVLLFLDFLRWNHVFTNLCINLRETRSSGQWKVGACNSIIGFTIRWLLSIYNYL